MEQESFSLSFAYVVRLSLILPGTSWGVGCGIGVENPIHELKCHCICGAIQVD
jgi:hypothetical protein